MSQFQRTSYYNQKLTLDVTKMTQFTKMTSQLTYPLAVGG